MKYSSTILFLRRLSLCLTLLLPAACQQEQDDVPDADGTQATGSVEVGFTLTTGSGTATTRTGTGEAVGTDAENYIDIANNNFRFLLFDTESKYLESFEPTSVTPAGTADNGEYQYYVQGELSQGYENFKLVVLANWPTYPGEEDLEEGTTTIEEVCTAATAAYSYASDFWPSTEDLIPMYGVRTYNDITLTPNLSTDLGTIDLLRAMSKVQVTCNAEGFTLEGVTLHNYYTSGMCAPKGVYSNTEKDWEANEAIHLPENPTTSTELALTKTDENTYVAYVPEYDNATKKNAYLSVTLTNAKGEEVILNGSKPSIYFQTYENGTAQGDDYDLVRNHWYNYTITAVDEEILTIEYSVLPWNLVESAIGWNVEGNFLMIAAGGNATDAKSGDAEATVCSVCRPRYLEKDEEEGFHDELEADKSSGAAFSFTLTAPEGAVWKAHLSNTDYFQFSSGAWSDTKNYVSTGIARDEEYRINITAKKNWTEGTDFDAPANEGFSDEEQVYTDFWITVSLDGVAEYALVINPENAVSTSNTYYKNGRRFAGDDTVIRIWQLRAVKEASYDDLVEYWGYCNEWWQD